MEFLSLRKARIDDAKLLFDWANDPDVRLNSFSPEPIVWKNHLIWLKGKLNSQYTKIFILQIDKIPVGQIRVDKGNENNWIIDYSIEKKFRGNGYGKLIIKELINKCEINLTALVKKENIGSQKIFESLGFNKNLENNLYVYSFFY